MSHMAAGLLVPCLLFDRVSAHVTWAVLGQAWPILMLGVFLVTIGCAFGYMASRVAPLSGDLRRAAIAATAFANSQAIPLLFVDVIGPEFGPHGANLGTTYIGLYLIVYLVLQWTIGASLLDVPELKLGGGSGNGSPIRGNGTPTHSRLAKREMYHDAYPEAYPGLTALQASRASDGVAMLDANVQASDAGEVGVVTCGDAGTPADEERGGGLRGARSGGGGWLLGLKSLAGRVVSPPVLGIAAGCVVGLTPQLHWLCISEGKHRAPLGFAIQAASVLGDAAIPINTMLLGASLARGPMWRAVPRATLGSIVLSKLLFMPLCTLALVAALSAVVPLPPMLVVVMVLESATPTANNLMMMCELAGGGASEFISTVIFAQYLSAPFLLTASLTAAMTLAHHCTPGYNCFTALV